MAEMNQSSLLEYGCGALRKLFIITLSCLVLAANALTYIPNSPRLRRDVSELFAEPKSEYLPPPANPTAEAELIPEEPMQSVAATPEEPSAEFAVPDTTPLPSDEEVHEEEIQDSAVLGDNGYEYKTVKRVVVRNRRDVSHLKLNYLPPLQQPSSEYLPPVNNKRAEAVQPSHEYLPPAATKEVQEVVETPTEAPQPSSEYLPPHNTKEEAKEQEVSTEAPEPSNEYLPPAKVEQMEEAAPLAEAEAEHKPETKSNEEQVSNASETPAEETTVAPMEEETTAAMEPEAATEAAPQEKHQEETAVFAADGYHYKQPSEVPAELFVSEPEPVITPFSATPEYLAPLEEGIVEAEGPSDGESAVLAEDGYHYRVIKRRF